MDICVSACVNTIYMFPLEMTEIEGLQNTYKLKGKGRIYYHIRYITGSVHYKNVCYCERVQVSYYCIYGSQDQGDCEENRRRTGYTCRSEEDRQRILSVLGYNKMG